MMTWGQGALGWRRVAMAGAVMLVIPLAGAGFPRAAAGPSVIPRPVELTIAGGGQTVSQTIHLSPAAYIVDSQEVELTGGYDVPLGNGWHDIDLKWSIISKLRCHDLGQDVCAANGLRFPNLACVLADGQQPMCGAPGWDMGPPQRDPGLRCPAHPNPPAHFTAAGQKVTICTTSLLGNTQAATVLTYFMGYDNGSVDHKTEQLRATWELSDPWNLHAGKPAPLDYRSDHCESPKKWRGKMPPTCAAKKYSGPFRRVYSAPGYFGASAKVTLPSAPSDVPPARRPQLTSQAGYLYLEAWNGYGEQAQSFEVGLVYHDGDKYGTNVYSLYWSVGRGVQTGGLYVPAGHQVRLAMYAYPAGHARDPDWPVPVPGCATVKACLILRAQDLTTRRVIFDRAVRADGWQGNHMMFARVTSIAQTPGPGKDMDGNVFKDGAVFGPIHWWDAELATLTPDQIKAAPWSTGGGQDWSADPTRIRVSGRQGLHAESDTIYLHPWAVSGSSAPEPGRRRQDGRAG
jgi:hypothetical protein